MKGWFSKVMKFDSIEGHKWTSCHQNIFKRQQIVIDVTSSSPLQVLRSTTHTPTIDSMHGDFKICHLDTLFHHLLLSLHPSTHQMAP
jgi:hypothetical protein